MKLDGFTKKPEGRRFVVATERTTATRFQSKMMMAQTTQVQTTQVQAQTQVQAHLAVVKEIRCRRRRCRRRPGLSGHGVSRFTESRSSLEFLRVLEV